MPSVPIISVIIPAYNAEKTIKETINSVLNQTFSDFELIIINDGSKDATLEIVSQFQDPRLKVMSYENSGASVSRNRGFAKSVGEFIAFLDADDLWTSDKLEAQLEALKAHPECDIAYSWTDCIDESSQFLRRGGYITVNGNAYAHLLLLDILENGSNPLIRRQALLDIGGFDESLPAGQDWDLYLRLAVKHQFVTVPKPQILYRVSSDSLSANYKKLETGSLRVIAKAFAQAPESLQYLKPYSLSNLYKYLSFKILQERPSSKKGLIAVRLIWNAVKHDPMLLQKRVILKVIIKIALLVLLPSPLATIVLHQMKKLLDTQTILGSLRLDPAALK